MERYERNIAVREIGPEGQKAICAARVLVCGAGGLGSTVITALSGLGVGKIGIVDSDRVEISNLNRQFLHDEENVKNSDLKAFSAKNKIGNYNGKIEVGAYPVRLTDENYPEIVRDYDILADCFDNFASKLLLSDIAVKTGKPLVHAGITGFKGQVTTIIPKKTGCLRCLFPINAEEDTNKGTLSPAVSLIGSIQAIEILKLILGQKDALQGKILFADALKMRFHTAEFSPQRGCKCQD